MAHGKFDIDSLLSALTTRDFEDNQNAIKAIGNDVGREKAEEERVAIV